MNKIISHLFLISTLFCTMMFINKLQAASCADSCRGSQCECAILESANLQGVDLKLDSNDIWSVKQTGYNGSNVLNFFIDFACPGSRAMLGSLLARARGGEFELRLRPFVLFKPNDNPYAKGLNQFVMAFKERYPEHFEALLNELSNRSSLAGAVGLQAWLQENIKDPATGRPLINGGDIVMYSRTQSAALDDNTRDAFRITCPSGISYCSGNKISGTPVSILTRRSSTSNKVILFGIAALDNAKDDANFNS